MPNTAVELSFGTVSKFLRDVTVVFYPMTNCNFLADIIEASCS